MKKLLLSFLISISPILAFSQFTIEGFENTSGPMAIPSTNWSLDSGLWQVFSNGVGTSRWGLVTTASASPLVYDGSNSAFIGNESNIGIGNTSQKWLASPLLYFPENATATTLSFYSRTFTSGDQGTKYKLMISPAESANDINAYTPLVEWSENTIGSPFDVYQEKRVDLSAFAGTEFHIAFVKEYTQTETTPADDRWYIDNISLDYSCGGNNCASTLALIPFVDSNGNGVKDTGEVIFDKGSFSYQVNNSGVLQYAYLDWYNQDSAYIFDNNHTNSYDISFGINSDFTPYYSCSTTYSNQATPASGSTSLYFPVTLTQPFTDAEISYYTYNLPRAESIFVTSAIYSNEGSQVILSGNLTFTKDPNTTVASVPVGAVITPTGFTYSFTNLLPGEHRRLGFINLYIPAIPTVSIGQSLTNNISIQVNNDAIPSNNDSIITNAVVASYDPNNISESHGEKIIHSTFTANDYLYYTIQFENTGNSYAKNINVLNTLDTALDENTFQMLSSSHNVHTHRLGSQLTWNFDDINLPPTLTNPNSSHGSILFRIKPKPGFAIGDIIPATASIYFDSNPAIVTETFNTEFVQTLGALAFDENNISLFPNPTSGSITIANASMRKIEAINIYEVSGKKVYASKSNIGETTIINVSGFERGIYFVELLSDSHSRIVKKLIVK